MVEDKQTTKTEEAKESVKNDKTVDTNKGAQSAVAKSVFGAKKMARKAHRKGPREEKRDEFDQRILDLARVTRVMAGGKRMRFRATVAVGDKKSKVGVGVGKGADVTIAVNKAVNDAKKNLVDVPMVNETIPHAVRKKHGAAEILFKPAKKGRGVIAGGVVRVVLELSGIKNITSKILGTNSKINNAKCSIEALRELKKVESPEKNAKEKGSAEKKELKKDVKKEEVVKNEDKK